MRIPLLLLPEKPARALAHPLLGIASRMSPRFSSLEKALYQIDAGRSATEYLALSGLNAIIYFVFVSLLSAAVLVKIGNAGALPLGIVCGLVAGMVVLGLGLIYPAWMGRQRVRQIDKNLLYAARHLRIQTTANVPLFEALVSASHGYGAVSEEFALIVKRVQAGEGMAYALEESATKNPSYYYSRIMWQLSNAVGAGTDIGPVLSDIVDFLAEEERIEMRNYGAQLNTLAIMYLMACIIAPTIGLIFLMVISSFVELPINDTVFYMILGVMVFIQYMFVGLIESRRPVVSV